MIGSFLNYTFFLCFIIYPCMAAEREPLIDPFNHLTLQQQLELQAPSSTISPQNSPLSEELIDQIWGYAEIYSLPASSASTPQ